jgi:hypothetical protein
MAQNKGKPYAQFAMPSREVGLAIRGSEEELRKPSDMVRSAKDRYDAERMEALKTEFI